MSVIVKEVTNKNLLRKWVDFPNKLYKNEENYVPFLINDEMDTFTKEKNPAYEFCETKLFLAYKNNNIVGRVCALINHAYNQKWNKAAIRFTRFDFYDDYEISKALFDEVVRIGKENKMTTIMGPIGFTDMDHEGMLVEGFDEFNMSITFYNFPYYINHMEKLGLVKDVDWVEYLLTVPNEKNEKFEKLSKYIIKKNGYQLVTYSDRKTLKKEAYEAFKVIDESFSKLYGTVPLTDKIIDDTIKNNVSLMNLKYICSVKDKNGSIVGFAVLVPSIAKALKKSNGRLFPFGIFRMLRALRWKNDVLEMYFIAVKPEHQKLGLPAIIMNHMIDICMKNKIKYCETGPELETNSDVQSMWKTFDVRKHKRRRCFIKEI